MDNMLVVIPARGASRGLPRKALRTAAGRPLIWYTLDYVCRLGLAERSVVVTDDREYADYVRRLDMGVGVVMEPPIPPDGENSARAFYRAVRYEARQGRPIDLVVALEPTAPVRPLNLVARCVDAIRSDVDIVVTVTKPNDHPARMVQLDRDGLIEGRVLNVPTTVRQEFPDNIYCIRGTCQVYQPALFHREPASLQEFWADRRIKTVEHAGFPDVDIDDPKDLAWFEFLLEHGYTMWSPKRQRRNNLNKSSELWEATPVAD